MSDKNEIWLESIGIKLLLNVDRPMPMNLDELKDQIFAKVKTAVEQIKLPEGFKLEVV